MSLVTLPYHFCTNGSVTRPILRPLTPSNGGTEEMGLRMRLYTHLNESMLQERCDAQLAPWSIDHWELLIGG